ncbi:MAG: hypothetical protein SFV51_11795 [Bryobacteraceae bacterium]|nr:hypothetical protein [Bryobacteraceae bacterium]
MEKLITAEFDAQELALEPVPAQGFPVESRREQRYILLGQVAIDVNRPVPHTIEGELCDVSNHGFRASYKGNLLSSGTEVAFRHHLFRGRARVVWSRHLPDHNESGFYILRD